MSSKEDRHTSITLHESTKKRFDETKPYGTVSADEFVDILLDVWDEYMLDDSANCQGQKHRIVPEEPYEPTRRGD